MSIPILLALLTFTILNTKSMKKKLILIRHAQAEPPQSGNDFDRLLTRAGERDARYLGRWLASEIKQVQTIITSTANRAKMTAEILSEELKAPGLIDEEEVLYEASVREMLDVIRSIEPNHQTAAVVAHNPTISYVADFLTKEAMDSMIPCTAVGIEFEDIAWSSVDQSQGSIVFFRPPEEY